VLPVVLLLWEARKPRGWRAGAVVLTQTILVNFLLKRLVDRPRPRPHGNTSSFPSGHTATAAAIAVGLGGQSTVHTAAIISGAAITGVSRIGKGVHWLSDVVAGAVIGAAVGLLVRNL
jgi:undecaprenyl-diphosphatase